MQFIKFTFLGSEYIKNQRVPLDAMCNGINVINTGATEAQINGIPLAAAAAGQPVGGSYSIGGNVGEILDGRVDITFPTGSGRVIVVQKIYKNSCI